MLNYSQALTVCLHFYCWECLLLVTEVMGHVFVDGTLQLKLAYGLRDLRVNLSYYLIVPIWNSNSICT